jgi:ParB family chromosome partitioning protein
MMAEKKEITYNDGKLYQIPLDSIHPDPNQSRKHFDKNALDELAASIKKHGIIQPVLFRLDEKGKLILVAGERRYRAAKKAGLEQIPAIFTDKEGEELNLVENLFRENLTPIEEAEALDRYREKKQCTHEDLADLIGKKRNTVTEILSLMRLPEEIRKELRSNAVCSRRVLVEIAKQKTDAKMRATYKKYKERGLTSDEVRKITRPHGSKVMILANAATSLYLKINALESIEEWKDIEIEMIKMQLFKLKPEIEKLDKLINKTTD